MESERYERFHVVAPIVGSAGVSTGATDVLAISGARSVMVGHGRQIVRHRYVIEHGVVSPDQIRAVGRAFAEWRSRRDDTRPVQPGEAAEFHACLRRLLRGHPAGAGVPLPEVRTFPTEAVEINVDRVDGLSVGEHNEQYSIENAVVDRGAVGLRDLTRDSLMVRDMFQVFCAGGDPVEGIVAAVTAALDRLSPQERAGFLRVHGNLLVAAGPASVRGPASVAVGDISVMASVEVARVDRIHGTAPHDVSFLPPVRTLDPAEAARILALAPVTGQQIEDGLGRMAELLGGTGRLPQLRDALETNIYTKADVIACRLGLPRGAFEPDHGDVPGWDNGLLAQLRRELAELVAQAHEELDHLHHELEPPAPPPPPPDPEEWTGPVFPGLTGP